MHKVDGSSPFIRFQKPAGKGGFFHAASERYLASRDTAEFRAESLQMGFSLARLVAELGIADGDIAAREPTFRVRVEAHVRPLTSPNLNPLRRAANGLTAHRSRQMLRLG